MRDSVKSVLALDSALGGCVAAVLCGEAAFQRSLETQREQAAKLIPLVQELMGEAAMGFGDLDLIVTTIGPGSFTGLRIGLSAARALGLALDCPVQGVTTFEAMARAAVPEAADALVIFETKRSDYYVQAFDAAKTPATEPCCLEQDALEALAASGKFILCGDGLPRFNGGKVGRVRRLLDPVILAHVGRERFLAGGGKAASPEPLYLRGADVSVSGKVQRQIKDLPL
ncbi:MAG: tRNA (adenosine(37)-N6)-threonylcarbamoyltransferase complex dimerization subunit type 1 TsaB [Micavibrio sp.]